MILSTGTLTKNANRFNMAQDWTIKDKREYEAWQREKESINRAGVNMGETEQEKKKRIAHLVKKGNELEFFKYYFGHLIDSEFSYFHKRDVKKVAENPDIFAMFEWARENAKSVIFDVMMPMNLKAKGELTGMMISSSSFDKAKTLLGDIQAELMFNKRFVSDFGTQVSLGSWQDGNFTTTDGIGFWAFGRGQSPLGVRKSEKRPNYGVFDDIDDAVLCRNESRVDEVVDWILGDFYGAMGIKGSRLIGLGNRIHKKGVVAKIVGDVEPDDPKREGLYHSKVYQLENPKTHQKDLSENGVPAWKERYTRAMILAKMKKMGWRIALKQYFHEHIVIGRVFREEHLPWVKVLPLAEYDALITYNDPSYKDGKKNDFKSILLIGRKGRYYDIIKAFCRQCSTPEMVRGHYNIAAHVPDNLKCRHYMEANFIQDMMLEEYWREGETRGKTLRIRGDKRSKPDKEWRIENLSPLTEQCFIRFNQEEKQSPDMQEVRNQFLGFPDAEHDDGPDSAEGGVFLLNQKGGSEKSKSRGPMRSGSYTRSGGARG